MTDKQSQFSLWWLAIRPKTLPAAAAPVAVGTALALLNNVFSPTAAFAAFLGALLLQIAVNLANDYFDAKNEIDSDERLGPMRVTQSGLIPPGQVRGAMIVCLLLAALVFAYLGVVGGVPIVIVGIASVLAALAYSGGPYPLASNGLGEVFVFLFFGLIAVCGTYWVQARSLSGLVIVSSLPPGLLVTAIMVVNNLRDRETDNKAGKKTLAVRIGRKYTIYLYRGLLIGSYLVPVAMIFTGLVDAMVLLPLVTGMMAWSLFREIGNITGSGLNETLARTAKLSLLFSFCFAVGIAV